MVNEKDLWIGDWVQLIKSGTKGKYEGKNKAGKARIKTEHKVILTTFKNLNIIDDPSPKINLQEDEWSKKHEPIMVDAPDANTIDLHMEKLLPDHQWMSPHRILDFQIEKCSAFIEKSISKRKHHIEIIHGKGSGTLKAEIEHLLRDFPEVKLILPARHQGAFEVWFQYP